MRILAVGDVVSTVGCEYLRQVLPALKRELSADAVIVNGENSAMGNGILPQSAQHLWDSGADLITTGNHALKRREIYELFDQDVPLIRPANFHTSAPGQGLYIIDKCFAKIAVINLQGTVYLENNRSPFDTADEQIAFAKEQGCSIIFVDFHAEATAEKRAMGFYLDGKVSAVFGTHTHVQTSDAQILPGGTAYITDLGMTGPLHSVLGIEPALAIQKIRTNLPVKFQNADGKCILEGCVADFDNKTGTALSIQPVRR